MKQNFMPLILNKNPLIQVFGKQDLIEKNTILLEKKFLSEFFKLAHNRIFFVNQEHDNYIIQIDKTNLKQNTDPSNDLEMKDCIDIADAMFTYEKNILLVVRTADCLPLFIHLKNNENKKEVVGVVHAGWKGLKKEIISKTLDCMLESFQLTYQYLPSLEINILIGPNAGNTKYEVGTEFKNYFSAYPKSIIENEKAKLFLDMVYIAKMEIKNGLIKYAKNHDYKLSNLEACLNINDKNSLCTLKNNKVFYSHRMGDFGRNLNIIGLLE